MLHAVTYGNSVGRKLSNTLPPVYDINTVVVRCGIARYRLFPLSVLGSSEGVYYRVNGTRQ
jgi:hypothetical protein